MTLFAIDEYLINLPPTCSMYDITIPTICPTDFYPEIFDSRAGFVIENGTVGDRTRARKIADVVSALTLGGPEVYELGIDATNIAGEVGRLFDEADRVAFVRRNADPDNSAIAVANEIALGSRRGLQYAKTLGLDPDLFGDVGALEHYIVRMFEDADSLALVVDYSISKEKTMADLRAAHASGVSDVRMRLLANLFGFVGDSMHRSLAYLRVLRKIEACENWSQIATLVSLSRE